MGEMHECQSRDYFQRRASEESAAAEKATDERAAQSHRELSDRYRNLASGTEQLAGDHSGTCGDGILSKDFRIVP